MIRDIIGWALILIFGSFLMLAILASQDEDEGPIPCEHPNCVLHRKPASERSEP